MCAADGDMEPLEDKDELETIFAWGFLFTIGSQASVHPCVTCLKESSEFILLAQHPTNEGANHLRAR